MMGSSLEVMMNINKMLKMMKIKRNVEDDNYENVEGDDNENVEDDDEDNNKCLRWWKWKWEDVEDNGGNEKKQIVEKNGKIMNDMICELWLMILGP